MPKTYVYVMYGLGGAMFSGGMETVVAANIRKLPNVICPPTVHFGSWPWIVEQIKKQPAGSKTVVIGHSMGAGAATRVTDFVKVDLVVCYDCAGFRPSRIGKNTGHLIDIYDVGFDPNPNYRPQAVSGQELDENFEHKIEQWKTNYGHTAVDDAPKEMYKIVERVKKLSES